MALLRRLFYRKPPDGLLEISERIYVFNCCFTTDAWEEKNYKGYVGGIVDQLREHFPDAQFLVFNFREEKTKSLIADVLAEYDITIMDYPRQYEGCPLLTMEVIHHFLRSTESWLSLGQQNVLMMHCEWGGWPVLAFMLAALLIYRKQYSGEQKTLDMIYKQAPHELLQLLSALNPIPSQLRYLQYISRRNVVSEWPPLDRALTLDCVILRFIPNFDGEGGCRPIFRIYGQDPFLVNDRSTKVLYATMKGSKTVRAYKQGECELVKIDINCHIQGDVVLECINLNDDMEREEMMFRVVFNTAFIRSNILMLNLDEVDIFWDAKELFPKGFRAEILFSDMDAAASIVDLDVSCFEEEGLPVEAFAKVHEIFNHVDWLDHKTDFAFNVLQQLRASNIIQEKSDTDSSPSLGDSPVLKETSSTDLQDKKKLTIVEDSTESSVSLDPKSYSVPSPLVSPDTNKRKEEKPQDSGNALQLPSQSDVMSQQTPESCLQDSPLLVSGHHDGSQASDGKPLTHDDESFVKAEVTHEMITSVTVPNTTPARDPAVPFRPQSVDVDSVSFSPPTPPPPIPPRPSLTSSALKTPPPPPPPPRPSELPSHCLSDSNAAHSSLLKESEFCLGDKQCFINSSQTSSSTSSNTTSENSRLWRNQTLELELLHPLLPVPPLKDKSAIGAGTPPPPPTPPVPPLKDKSAIGAGPPPPPPPPPPICSGQPANSTVSSSVPPLPPPTPPLSSNSPSVPSAPPPPVPFGKGASKTRAASPSSGSPVPPPPLISPSSSKGRLSRTISSRSQQTKKLKPLHWLKLTRAVSGSLWAEAMKSSDTSKAPEIDMSELESLFSAAVANSDGGKSSRRSAQGPKSDKVQLIDHRRAYNCEIMLSKVKVPLRELMSSVLDLEESALDVDQVENLIKFCPTKEEMDRLKGYTGEKEKLGRCEQFFLELMQVPRVESKLRVFSFKIQFRSQVSDLRSSLNVVNSASEEALQLDFGWIAFSNSLIHGHRNSKMTLMHYLCKVLADRLPELLDFSGDLTSLEPAARVILFNFIQLKFLAEEMQALSKGLEKVVQELTLSENDGPMSVNFHKNLKEFLRFAEAEIRTLASLYSGVGRNVDALILYFGEDPSRCPFEQVISTLHNFVKMFRKAHQENCKQHELEMKKLAAESPEVEDECCA
ncbi:hypothetical protein Pint_14595 [Pistacia integerrima]|uniref:Uncharacterized protein n=1 Tax=Pistacia integerrima TaxID=434235 RepID=A0ACC0Y7Y9_9ROSI|nr:hypothetical protein Pint_14595 [Pistacia integerrima]